MENYIFCAVTIYLICSQSEYNAQQKIAAPIFVNFVVPQTMLYCAQVGLHDILFGIVKWHKKLYPVFIAVEVRKGLVPTTQRLFLPNA